MMPTVAKVSHFLGDDHFETHFETELLKDAIDEIKKDGWNNHEKNLWNLGMT